MSDRYVRGLITANPPADPDPALGAAASGMWTMEQYFALQKQGKWPTKDPYFNQTTLLLHGDGGLSGATNNGGDPTYLAFADNSDNDFPITVNGNARGDNSSPFQVGEGEWSVYFDGDVSDARINTPSSSSLSPGSSNFSAEVWINCPVQSSTGMPVFIQVTSTGGAANTNWGFFGLTTGEFRFSASDGSTYQVTMDTGISVSDNEWHHLAVSRDGSNWAFFVDGTRVATATWAGTVSTTARSVWLGSNQSSTVYYKGYLSNASLVIGSTVYDPTSTTITVPTSPLSPSRTNQKLLACYGNRFADFNTATTANTLTITNTPKVQPLNPFTTDYNTVDGSGYFDGTGDYLAVGSASDWAFLSNTTASWTIEMWVYNNTSGTTTTLLDTAASTTANIGCYVQKTNTEVVNVQIVYGSAGNFIVNGSSNVGLKANSWNHIFITYDQSLANTNLVFYINGAAAGTANKTGNTPSSSAPANALSIATYGAGVGQFVTGYISSVRISNTVRSVPSGVPTAPYTSDANTSLLTLQYQGAVRNGGFIDSSPNDFPITANGNTTQGTFSPFSLPDGRWSNYFDGTGDAVRASASSLSMSSFTIESWINYSGDANIRAIFDFVNAINGYGVLAVYSNSISSIRFQFFSTNSVGSLIGNIDVVWTSYFNKWVHLACTYDGSTYRVFVNGTIAGTLSSATPVVAINSLTIGGRGDPTPSQIWQGYISNMRFVTGAALYTSDFTPPTSPLTTAGSGTTQFIFAQSNRFVDTEGNYTFTLYGNPKVTPFSPFAPTAAYSPSVNGGSGYFDGTGDYLTFTDASNDLDMGGLVASLDVWFYPTQNNAYSHFFGKSGGTWNWNTTNGVEYAIAFNAGQFYVAYNSSGTGVALNDPTTGRPLNQWYWIVVATDASNNLALFVNGSRVATTTNAITKPTTRTGMVIGANSNGTEAIGGYVSGHRFISGSGAYDPTDTTLTVPTAPPSPTGTELCLTYINAGIFDNTGKNVLETVGNAQVDTSTVKFGTGSMKFDGTGDVLYVLGNPELCAFGTGDFTIEMWFYLDSFAHTYNALYDSRPISTQGVYPNISVLSNGKIYYYVNSAERIASSTGAISTGQWYHLAVSRSGTSTKMFIDGTQVGITYSDSNNYLNTTGRPAIGAEGFNSPTNDNIDGYIDDLRITKGVARYTSNFTPQTSQWQNQ